MRDHIYLYFHTENDKKTAVQRMGKRCKPQLRNVRPNTDRYPFISDAPFVEVSEHVRHILLPDVLKEGSTLQELWAPLDDIECDNIHRMDDVSRRRFVAALAEKEQHHPHKLKKMLRKQIGIKEAWIQSVHWNFSEIDMLRFPALTIEFLDREVAMKAYPLFHAHGFEPVAELFVSFSTVSGQRSGTTLSGQAAFSCANVTSLIHEVSEVLDQSQVKTPYSNSQQMVEWVSQASFKCHRCESVVSRAACWCCSVCECKICECCYNAEEAHPLRGCIMHAADDAANSYGEKPHAFAYVDVESMQAAMKCHANGLVLAYALSSSWKGRTQSETNILREHDRQIFPVIKFGYYEDEKSISYWDRSSSGDDGGIFE